MDGQRQIESVSEVLAAHCNERGVGVPMITTGENRLTKYGISSDGIENREYS